MKPVKILFLSANPAYTDRLRVDKEMREIEEALRQTKYRDNFKTETYGAVRFFDLQNYLLLHKPNIVHFSGHGSPSNEILLEDDDGHSQPISARAISKLFEVLKNNIRCVLLNACYSEVQAHAIAKCVDCVIGMSKKISDSASTRFAKAFYNALGYGKDVESAFQLGCANIESENLDEQDTPKLLTLKSKPSKIVFVNAKIGTTSSKTNSPEKGSKIIVKPYKPIRPPGVAEKPK